MVLQATNLKNFLERSTYKAFLNKDSMNVTRCHHSNNGTPSNAQLLIGTSVVEEFCSRIMPPKKKKGKSNINKSKTKNKKTNEGMFFFFSQGCLLLHFRFNMFHFRNFLKPYFACQKERTLLTGLCISEDCLIHCVHAGGNELAEKYRRSALDVTILRDHLGENTRVRPLFRAPKMRSLKAEHRL